MSTFSLEVSPRASPRSEPTFHPTTHEKATIRINPREQTVLFAVGTHRTYGWEIHHHIQECSQGQTKITVGAIYTILRSLEKKGLVIGEESIEQKRRYFTTTDLGKKLIESILAVQFKLLRLESSRTPNLEFRDS